MRQIGLALIGCGGIARVHAAAAWEGRVRIVAVADPNPESRQALAQQTSAPAYESLEALLKRPPAQPLDGIVLCTPPSVRIGPVEQALERGLGVLIEKPLSHTLGDGERLLELASAYPDRAMAVAYCHRFVPAVQAIRRLTRAGDLGPLVRFENTFATWRPTMAQHWMSDPAVSGGGSLLDTGSHSLDLFHFLVGPAKLEAAVLRHSWPGRGESSATILVRNSQTDTAGVISSGWTEPARFTLALIGERASAFYDYEQPHHLVLRTQEAQQRSIPVEGHESRFARQLEAFADLIENPTRPTDLASVADAWAVMRLADAAQRRVGDAAAMAV
jgi:predicted dehydrogenase